VRAILAALLCLCACQSAAAEAIPLRYGQAYSALRSIFALPLLVAEREGYFVHEGLDFSMLPVPGGGEKLIAALHDGTADISHVATPFLIQAALAVPTRLPLPPSSTTRFTVLSRSRRTGLMPISRES